MTGTTRITVFGALATLLTALSLTPLLDNDTWFWQAAVAVIAVAGAGEAARRFSVPLIVLVPLQAAVLLGYLTFAFARDEAVLGLLPGPSALAALGDLTRQAIQDINDHAAPVSGDGTIAALTVAGIGLIGISVDVLAATLGRAALAGLPMLALYTVPATLLEDGLAWPLFLLSGVGYVGLLLAEGRERFTRWGRPLVRQGRTPPGAIETAPVARAGRRIGAAVLGVAALAPALLPGLAEGVLNMGGSGFGEGSGSGAITTNNPIVTLRRDLNLPGNIPLMWVRTAGAQPEPQYLRLVSLDVFNGEEWQPSRRDVRPIPEELPAPEALSDEVARRAVRNQISVTPGYAAQWLPLPHPVIDVEIDGEWRYGEEEGDIVGAPGQTTENISYRTTSLAVTPAREQLRGAAPPPEEIAGRYTQLPDHLPPAVGRLARTVAGGQPTAYDQALALQEWFTDPRQFSYDATAKSGNSSNALAEFLRDREGYCEQFAATMAVMARLLGIPARVAVGFTPGELRPGGSYLIGAHDAHAWPELFFSGVGWVRFEPTPTIGGGRGSTPDWAVPELPQGDPGSSQGSQPGVPRRTDPDAAGCQVTPGLPECRGQLGGLEAGPLDGGGRGAGDGVARWPYAAGAAVMLVGLTPMMLRSALRRRRLAAATDPVRRVQGAWAELRDSAQDLGYAWSPAQTIRQVRGRLSREGRLEGPAEEALGRIVGTVERARYARAPGDVGDLFTDVRVVKAALAAQVSGRTRWRARLLPPSELSRLWRSAERTVGTLHRVDRWTSRWAERLRDRLPRLHSG